MKSSSHNSLSSGSGHPSRISAVELSYSEMTTDVSGRVMSKTTKENLRKQHGYCLSCPQVPVLLYDIRRHRMNPLKMMKTPRSVAGECIEGKCLKCNAELDPRKKNRRTFITSSPSFHSRSTQSFGGASFSSLSSLESMDSEIAQTPLARLQAQQSSDSFNARRARLPPTRNRSNSSCLIPRSSSSSDFENTNASFRVSRNSTPPPELTLSKNSSFNSTRSNGHWARYKGESSRSVATLQSEASIEFSTTEEIQPHKKKNSCDLNDLFSNLKAIGCIEILTETILTSMKTHSSDENAQGHCLATIADTFEDMEQCNSGNFVESGGGLSIVRAMKAYPFSPQVQERGCAAIGVLAADEGNRTALIDAGCCEAVLKATTKNFGDVSLVSSAFIAIRIFSTELEGRNELNKMSAAKTIVEAMQCNMSVPTVQSDGCAILSNLAVDANSKTVSKVSKAEITVIVRVMEVHQDNEAVVASACFALKNLSYNEDNLRSISKSKNILNALEGAMHFSSILSVEDTMEKIYLSRAQDESLEEATIKTLNNRLSSNTAEPFYDPDIIHFLLETIEEFNWSSNIVAHCLKHIQDLTSTSDHRRRIHLKGATKSKVRGIVENFEHDSDGIDLLVLKELCDSDDAS